MTMATTSGAGAVVGAEVFCELGEGCGGFPLWAQPKKDSRRRALRMAGFTDNSDRFCPVCSIRMGGATVKETLSSGRAP